jgi:hypothetical protein
VNGASSLKPQASSPPLEAYESLRRALGALRLVQVQSERHECLERLARAVAEGRHADMAGELLAQARDECERALVYAGLADGMARSD